MRILNIFFFYYSEHGTGCWRHMSGKSYPWRPLTHTFLCAGRIFHKFRAVEQYKQHEKLHNFCCKWRWCVYFEDFASISKPSYQLSTIIYGRCLLPFTIIFSISNSLHYRLLDRFTLFTVYFFTFFLRLLGFDFPMHEKLRILLLSHLLNSLLFC